MKKTMILFLTAFCMMSAAPSAEAKFSFSSSLKKAGYHLKKAHHYLKEHEDQIKAKVEYALEHKDDIIEGAKMLKTVAKNPSMAKDIAQALISGGSDDDEE